MQNYKNNLRKEENKNFDTHKRYNSFPMNFKRI